MQLFMQQLVNGISLGSIYALIALGYTMVYGTIKLINFAHGDVFMLGSFIGFYLVTQYNMNVFLAMLIAMVMTAILGAIIERVAYKPLRNSTRITALITAIGVSYFIQNVMIYFVGPEVKAFPSPLPTKIIKLGSVVINTKQILVFVVTIATMILLNTIVQKTKMGKAMRAVAVDSEAAQLMGIDVNRVISFTFALGSAMAGIAGVLYGIYYNSISATMGATPGLKAFIAAVIGGIGSIPGAMLGGYLIGILETIVTFMGGSMYKDAVVYGLLIVILLVMPSGLFGSRVKEKV